MRTESYITITDCYLFKVPKALFKEVMDEFDDFRSQVESISKQREWMRLARIQAFKLGVDEETFIGQHAIDQTNVERMEARLEEEQEPELTARRIDVKLENEKKARWNQIALYFTLRESEFLGIQDEIIA